MLLRAGALQESDFLALPQAYIIPEPIPTPDPIPTPEPEQTFEQDLADAEIEIETVILAHEKTTKKARRENTKN
jgi:hypothetical protein